MYAEAAHLAAMMVDESAMQLDSTSIKPLIDELKMESGDTEAEASHCESRHRRRIC